MSKTRRLVLIAILSAVSFLLMFFSFSIVPGADFLKVEFSIIPALIGLIMMDLKSAYAIIILRSLLKLILNNSGVNDFIGLPMNIIALGLFVTVFALLWNHKRTRKNYIVASIVAGFVLTAAMLLLNYFYAIPLYAKFANFDIGQFIGIAKYMLAMVLPFNLIQSLIFAFSFYFIYIASKPILERYL